VELGEIETAQAIFSTFSVMAVTLKEENFKRWLEIDKILIRKSFNAKQVYYGGSKEAARQQIISGMCKVGREDV
jgi:hypothetical protein